MGEGFELEGHRGARGLKPENTLPSFEIAFDLGATAVETDLHLTRDGVPVLIHDHRLSARIFRRRAEAADQAPNPAECPWVSRLTLAQLRMYQGDLNPDPGRFPEQNNEATLLARSFADQRGLNPFAIPTLADLLQFAEAYASDAGARAGKTNEQRQRMRHMRFDLELKRVPFYPERIGDSFSGTVPGLLEERVAEVLGGAGVIGRTIVRSFDHRCVRAMKSLLPEVTGAVLVAGTAPVNPAQLATLAGAHVYCPEYHFLDELQVQQLHAEGFRVLPWTVNEPEDWRRLLDWGVDGITTDYPDRLAIWLGDHQSARYNPCPSASG